MGRESDAGNAGVQSIGSAVVDVTPGNHFEQIARQTSSSTKNVAADELTWLRSRWWSSKGRQAHRRMRLPCDLRLGSCRAKSWLNCRSYFLLVGFFVVDEAWLLMLEGWLWPGLPGQHPKAGLLVGIVGLGGPFHGSMALFLNAPPSVGDWVWG